MSYKKSIVTVMTLMILLLLMMTTTIQAASLTKVTGLTGDFNGSSIILKWNSVSGADGYGIFEDGKCIGYINDNQAGLIGFQENTTYYLKVAAYTEQYGQKKFGPESTEITVRTTVTETLGKVTGFSATQVNGQVSLNWSSVSKATKYQIFADIPDFGSIMIGEVPTTGAIISNCVNKEKYTFKVRACQELSNGTTKYGDCSTSKTITIDSNKTDDDDYYYNDLDQVKNLKVSDVTKNTAYLEWNEVKYADGYEIWVLENGDRDYKHYDDTSREYYKLTGLYNNTKYEVKVVAYETANGHRYYGKESSYKTFTTSKQSTDLDQVKGLKVSDVTDSSAYVEWNKVDYADGYDILVNRENRGYEFYDDTTRDYYKLTGLYEDTSYKVKVVAYEKINGEKEYGPESSYKSFKTEKDEEYNEPSQVKNLKYDVDGDEVTLSWSKVSGADGYDIYLGKGNSSPKYKTTTSSTKVTLDDLDYDTTYKVKVRAYKIVRGDEIPGDFSTTKTFTTDKDKTTSKLGKVQHLSERVEHKNEAYLQWWPLDGADGYTIYLSENGRSFEEYKNVDENTTILYDLEYNTNYKVKVKAYRFKNNRKEYSNSYSNTVSFKTEKYDRYQNDEDVGRVENVRDYVVGDTVYLSWDKVSGADNYQIEFTVPGIGGVVTFYTTDTSREISGLTDKKYEYTARVRAYDNRTNTWGPYSEIVKFTGK